MAELSSIEAEIGRRIIHFFLDLCILKELHKGGQYGYGVKKSIYGTWKIYVNNENLYTTLRRLERNKLVVSEKRVERGRQRTYYRVTEEGGKYFKELTQCLRLRLIECLNSLQG